MSLNSWKFLELQKNPSICHGGSTSSLSDRHSNLREEQLDQAWEILTQDFPHGNDHEKRMASFDILSPKFGGEHVFFFPQKKFNKPPQKKIIPSDSVKMSSKIQKKTWISPNQVLPNPHFLPRRLPFVQLDNSQRGAVGCDIRTSVQRVENFSGKNDVFEDLGKKHKVSRVYLIWYQIWCVYIYYAYICIYIYCI